MIRDGDDVECSWLRWDEESGCRPESLDYRSTDLWPDVPGYKSENVRKLPYYETGARFTYPEPFPQLDALDEKLDIFNLNRAPRPSQRVRAAA